MRSLQVVRSLRGVVAVAAVVAVVSSCEVTATPVSPPSEGAAGSSFERRVDDVAGEAGVDVGVTLIDVESGRVWGRAQERRFPMLSTFKAYAVGALLDLEAQQGGVLDERVEIRPGDLVENSPFTSGRVGAVVSMGELAQAALQVSDNTAGNLLLRRIGGPAAVGQFARSAGDFGSRLDRWEPALNSAELSDDRDTTTAGSLARGYLAMLEGQRLPAAQRELLLDWMERNSTSSNRFRQQLPPGWRTVDKTGAGENRATNDAGLLISPQGRRLLLVVLSRSRAATDDGPPLNSVIAQIAQAATVLGDRQ